MNDDTLDAIRARAEAATPGPWRAHGDGHVGSPHHIGGIFMPTVGHDPERRYADAMFAAHAREDVPALLDEVETLRAVRDEWQRIYNRTEAERDRLRAAVDAVRALHKPVRYDGTDWCSDCVAEDAHDAVEVPWPCPTIRALDEHLGDQP